MILPQYIEKENIDNYMAIGKCPICDKDAEAINSVRQIDEHYTTVHANEYYKHYMGDSGVGYIRKIKNPKTRWS